MALFDALVVCVSPSADFSAEKAFDSRAKMEKLLRDNGATIVKSVTKKVWHRATYRYTIDFLDKYLA